MKPQIEAFIWISKRFVLDQSGNLTTSILSGNWIFDSFPQKVICLPYIRLREMRPGDDKHLKFLLKKGILEEVFYEDRAFKLPENATPNMSIYSIISIPPLTFEEPTVVTAELTYKGESIGRLPLFVRKSS